ncbi:MAG: radical SAM protein [Proteobacteria bacterium]|nr:radical SAM protein [Pseudomonadota bacterium]MBU1715670.1 radical SAM protein [Pseudomonadota bacterium]
MKNKLKDNIQQAKIACGILDKKVYTGPWHVQIDLTNKCNNDCIACWCNSPLLGDKAMRAEIKNKFLPFEVVIKLVDELDALGARDLYFTGGGEPFMHPRILDIMRHIKSKGMRLDMSTNFTLVTKEIAEQLIEIGVDHMNISLWAATPETYSKLHPNKNEQTFLKMTEIIDFINARKAEKQTLKPALGMYNVITSESYLEIIDMLEFAHLHRMNDINFVPVDTMPGKTDVLSLNAKQRQELSELVATLPAKRLEFQEKYQHEVLISNLEMFAQRIRSDSADEANYDAELLSSMPSCYAGWSFARILATGEVNSCLKSFKIPVGNIFESSFPEIWFGAKQHEFRAHTIDYDINDPYLKSMGNDMQTEGQGCMKCCDNLGLNMSVHEKMIDLDLPKKILIRLANLL